MVRPAEPGPKLILKRSLGTPLTVLHGPQYNH